MKPKRATLFAALLIIGVADAAKILFICPSLSPSMVLLSGRIADVLVQNGHDVVGFLASAIIIISCCHDLTQ